MKAILKIISFIGLGLTIVPAILVYQGTISLAGSHNLMIIGALAWFLTAPLWMGKKTLKKTAI